MIQYLTLGVCIISLAVLLVLCWTLRPIIEEQQETLAIGFRHEPQEDPFDSEDPNDRGC